MAMVRLSAAVPHHIEPMLAILSKMPHDEENYAFEFKWDGIRAVSFWDGKKLRIESRNQIDITARYPEFEILKKQLGKKPLVLDGEIVAIDAKGRTSFNLLQGRMGQSDPHAQKILMKTIPATYMIFDLLFRDDIDLTSLPYHERREFLEGLKLEGESWKVSPYQKGNGSAMLEVARKHSMEGLIAKEFESPYLPGRRSDYWKKIKIVQGQEFVIGGWMPGEGAITGGLGALLLGFYVRSGKKKKLMYAGNVGTGFSLEERVKVQKLLEKQEAYSSPFEDLAKLRGAHFCRPVYIAEIEFRGWTDNQHIRQGSFKGLREDKNPKDIVREVPES